MRIPFTQIDAFADAPFGGNPAAVMPLAGWLPDAILQAIAQENNLAETAFIVPCADPETADFDLRWFTPGVEVALCGHATLAAGHLVLSSVAGMEKVRFSTNKAGVLTVGRGASGYEMALPSWPAADAITGSALAAIGAALGAVPDEVWGRGSDYRVAVFGSAAEVRALDPDFRAIIALFTGRDLQLIATAPGAGDASGADVVSRVFVPEAGVDEDSVTGSAHAIITSYWARRLGRDAFSAYQASARGGRVGCRLDGEQVVLSGSARTVIEGEFILD
ncbi:phenazine biosynthesis protein [Polymorphobacter glacialis]|uniref:Phenazine biosynthesis protein n=1 Tax=Sandarakinorhabdus glacialis TaxID=1614636 RepID=A0A916ZNT8_9SPHN|nr:PhzF family phenazine biosynthesis protein [Polymorphobacter glacialis]GGE06765.1 phenazine biosynthesis protein [Polymorphobacter glacialis]